MSYYLRFYHSFYINSPNDGDVTSLSVHSRASCLTMSIFPAAHVGCVLIFQSMVFLVEKWEMSYMIHMCVLLTTSLTMRFVLPDFLTYFQTYK